MADALRSMCLYNIKTRILRKLKERKVNASEGACPQQSFEIVLEKQIDNWESVDVNKVSDDYVQAIVDGCMKNLTADVYDVEVTHKIEDNVDGKIISIILLYSMLWNMYQ